MSYFLLSMTKRDRKERNFTSFLNFYIGSRQTT
nr:MAG TPA: hypothetical protein [Caudoviricetes sp.]